ncbi:MAG: TolC family outer membrane protein [Burkholderiaceae bacterium]|nr:TolC family outer membrane protein [Burkholderiaceae bacterium]
MRTTHSTLARAVAAALLAFAGSTWAQAPATPAVPAVPAAAARNDLLAVFRLALANDPVFASARFTRQAAVEREPQARAALLPNVGASLGYNATQFDSKTPDFSRSFNGWGPSIQASLPLYRPQAWNALDQARLQVQTADAQFAQAQQDLVLRVSQAYFDVLSAQDDLTAIEASKKAVSEQLAQARREFEVGTKTIVDTHEAQARFDQIVAQEQVARGTLIVRQNALRSIIGVDPGPLVPLAERPALTPPQPSNVETWARQAEDSSFGVQAARLNAEIARIGTKAARNGHLPTVDLTASLGQNRSSGSVNTTTSNTTTTGVIGVQLNVPIYSGGLTQSRVREALAFEQRSEQDLESARRTANQSAKQAFTGVDFGLAQVRALESAEVSARSQLESTRLGYQVGVRINLDVLNATTQLFATQRDLKKARYDFLVNGLRLESAVGSLDENDVQAINALLVR